MRHTVSDRLTGTSVSSQCLHHFLVGLLRLGASGSTITRMYFLSCQQREQTHARTCIYNMWR